MSKPFVSAVEDSILVRDSKSVEPILNWSGQSIMDFSCLLCGVNLHCTDSTDSLESFRFSEEYIKIATIFLSLPSNPFHSSLSQTLYCTECQNQIKYCGSLLNKVASIYTELERIHEQIFQKLSKANASSDEYVINDIDIDTPIENSNCVLNKGLRSQILATTSCTGTNIMSNNDYRTCKYPAVVKTEPDDDKILAIHDENSSTSPVSGCGLLGKIIRTEDPCLENNDIWMNAATCFKSDSDDTHDSSASSTSTTILDMSLKSSHKILPPSLKVCKSQNTIIDDTDLYKDVRSTNNEDEWGISENFIQFLSALPNTPGWLFRPNVDA